MKHFERSVGPRFVGLASREVRVKSVRPEGSWFWNSHERALPMPHNSTVRRKIPNVIGSSSHT